jgi:hypothetical protein
MGTPVQFASRAAPADTLAADLTARLAEQLEDAQAPPISQRPPAPATPVRWSAAAIVEAGAKARAMAPPPLPSNPTAAAILRAGQKARGEIRDDKLLPPRGSTAWQILAAGAKARGEDFP